MFAEFAEFTAFYLMNLLISETPGDDHENLVNR
jgi:hypothetical protein